MRSTGGNEENIYRMFCWEAGVASGRADDAEAAEAPDEAVPPDPRSGMGRRHLHYIILEPNSIR